MVVLVGVVLVAGAVFFGTIPPSGSVSISHSSTATTTTPSTRSAVSATCTQTESAPLFLIVRNDNGTPIPSQPLTIQAHLFTQLVYNSNLDSCIFVYSTHSWMNRTGTDGKIELGWTGNYFNITTVYLGRTYQVNAEAEGAESAECVTLSLPSGSVNTTYAGMFDYQC